MAFWNNHAPYELYCISNNEYGDFIVVLKLETVIFSEAMVLLGRSVHPTTFFLGSCYGISQGRGGEYSDILVLYVGADRFGGFKALNFSTY